MWTIREDQVIKLRESVEARALSARVQDIKNQIEQRLGPAESSPTDLNRFERILETVSAARGFNIQEFEDQVEWADVRLNTGRIFWEEPHICGILNDSLIHPKAKARYAVLLARIADDSPKRVR